MPTTPTAPSHLRNIERWGALSQAFHWLIVIGILTMAIIGLTMVDMPSSPDKVRMFALHKSIGLTILVLVTLRLAWRLYAGSPPDVPMPRWQHLAANLSHVGLYVLLFAVPLSGWVMNSAAGFPLWWFGLFRVPALVGKDHDFHETMEDVHELLFWALILLVLVHAGAALYHHLFQRDATLARMLPRGWIRDSEAAEDVRHG
ncbi:Cytochrome B561 [Lysobacter dokdonensis DS-58]|uniref:Cytochrome B561 n=1 Tax=Lysobacter dokdonensis DS-58 TaxID=1300345 RepID=A0A0A2WXQ7_9GAMM|nr:cytochrome b [Lysobacter dokdonensis]KGQ17789.1 Cytochrome B561 [Lysobacter dokdonensis DS-58]